MIGTPSTYTNSKLIGRRSPDSLPPGSYYVNLKEDDNIVASLYVKKYKESYVIHDVFVLEDRRGKGYGKKIMEEILGLLRPKNKPVYLYVDPSNKVAINLYEKIGFRLDKKNAAFGDRLILVK